MPRPSKGPRLVLQKAKDRQPLWIIRDGQRTLGTGCPVADREGAERRLAAYITGKHDPKASRGGGDPNAIKIADALSVYMTEKITTSARPKAGIAMVERLGRFFGERTIGELNGALQRAYVAQRSSQSMARRELETLSAAVNYHIREAVGGANLQFRPVLPDAPPARQRWLTRGEAARLVRAAWRNPDSRHVARFILVGLYTGTRAGAICGAALMPTIGRGYVNLDTGHFVRLAYGKKQTNKRQPTVELPPRLVAHIRRWHRIGVSKGAVIEYRGKPVERIKVAWNSVVKTAGLATDIKQDKVIPHTLRHTAISWYLRSGVPPHLVSDYCGVSEAIIRAHYRHHIPGGFDGVLRASARLGR
jgi:integrase